MIPMMAVRIEYFRKSCGEDVSDMSDEDFPFRRKKRFTGKNGVELRKNQLKENQAEKGKKHLEYIFQSEDVQRLKGSRKDCKMIFQARTEEK